MAIAFVNSGSGFGDADATSVATGATSLTAANLIVVGICYSKQTNAGVVISSITDTAGNTYTQCTSAKSVQSNDITDVWYAKNVTGNASNVVTVNFSLNAPFRRVITHQYSGCDTTAPFDVASPGATAAGTSVTSGNLITGTANEVIFAVATSNNSATWSAGTSFTVRNTAVGTDSGSEERIVSATSTYTAPFTCSVSGRLTLSAATFKQAAAGGGNVTFNMGTTQAILTLSGLVYAKLLATVKPPQSTVTLSGIVAKPQAVFKPPQASVTFNGIVPTKLLATVKPPLGTITFSGIVPTKLLATVKPPISSMSLTGIVPTKELARVSPPLAVFRFVGNAPVESSGTTAGPKQWIRQIAINFVASVNDHISR